MAIIDAQGNVLDYGAYYLTNSEKLKQEAQKKLAEKIRKFNVTLLSIGMVRPLMKQNNLRLR